MAGAASSNIPPQEEEEEEEEEKQTQNNNIPSLRSIETALKLVDSKKQNLKRAFEDLQSLPFSSSFLTFSWSHLDSHFSSLHQSLSQRFLLLLHNYDSATDPPLNEPDPEVGSVSICKRMDGAGLRGYVDGSDKDRNLIRVELVGSLRFAPDPGSLVLDALEGFSSFNLRKKRACVALLEALVEVKPGIKEEVKERAKKLGLEWKKMVNLKAGGVSVEALGFLNLVAAYGLAGEFDNEELVDYFVTIGATACAPGLCRQVGLEERANAYIIEKLMHQEKQLFAVRFICELGLADKFHPVDTLIRYLKRLKKIRNKNCKEGKYSVSTKNQIRSKEIKALESALRIIDEYKLKYPKVNLEERIKLLEKQKADELLAPSPDKSFQIPKGLEKNQKRLVTSGNKRPRTITPTGPVPMPIGFVGSPLPPMGLLPAAGPYGLVDPITPYASSSARPCDFPGTSVGYQGNPNTPWPHQFPLEPYMPAQPLIPAQAYTPPQPCMPLQHHMAAQPYMPPPFGGYGLPNSHHPPYQPH